VLSEGNAHSREIALYYGDERAGFLILIAAFILHAALLYRAIIHTCLLAMCSYALMQDSPTTTIWVIAGWDCSIPQAPALRFQGVSVCVCVCMCVCVCVCVRTWGQPFLCVCQVQSGPAEAGRHRGKQSAAEEEGRGGGGGRGGLRLRQLREWNPCVCILMTDLDHTVMSYSCRINS